MKQDESFFRIAQLPPYPLGKLAESVSEVRMSGREVIDLSQVNPSLGVPSVALDKLVQASLREENHRYSASRGIVRLRSAVCELYRKRYDVELCEEEEVVVTMGAKEGISHLLLAALSPGDTVLVPTPSYPIHTSSVFIAGAGFVGVPVYESAEEADLTAYSLSAKSDGFFERLDTAYNSCWPRPRILLMSFPHNPTTTVVDLSFWERTVEFAKQRSMFVVNDFAYADLAFEKGAAPSILEVPGARELAVDCYSLSKGFNIPGWRIGFCLGNPQLVSALRKIKSYMDFGVFQPLQIAAASLLEDAVASPEQYFDLYAGTYQARRDVLAEGLQSNGWQVTLPKATVFVWARLPDAFLDEGSFAFCERLLRETGVAACPGEGFDVNAREFVRFALVEDESKLRRALQLIGKMEAG